MHEESHSLATTDSCDLCRLNCSSSEAEEEETAAAAAAGQRAGSPATGAGAAAALQLTAAGQQPAGLSGSSLVSPGRAAAGSRASGAGAGGGASASEGGDCAPLSPNTGRGGLLRGLDPTVLLSSAPGRQPGAAVEQPVAVAAAGGAPVDAATAEQLWQGWTAFEVRGQRCEDDLGDHAMLPMGINALKGAINAAGRHSQ